MPIEVFNNPSKEGGRIAKIVQPEHEPRTDKTPKYKHRWKPEGSHQENEPVARDTQPRDEAVDEAVIEEIRQTGTTSSRHHAAVARELAGSMGRLRLVQKGKARGRKAIYEVLD